MRNFIHVWLLEDVSYEALVPARVSHKSVSWPLCGTNVVLGADFGSWASKLGGNCGLRIGKLVAQR